MLRGIEPVDEAGSFRVAAEQGSIWMGAQEAATWYCARLRGVYGWRTGVLRGRIITRRYVVPAS
jgi:hypothetical protein